MLTLSCKYLIILKILKKKDSTCAQKLKFNLVFKRKKTSVFL